MVSLEMIYQVHSFTEIRNSVLGSGIDFHFMTQLLKDYHILIP